METVGAYAFVTSDWKEKDYPLDLWLEHHLKLFDQVALVTYGKADVPEQPKLIVKEMRSVSEERYSFYQVGKSEAQKLLDTDWKVLLDIDEFFSERIPLSDLDKRYAYAIRHHNLFGNVFTEIENKEFPIPSFHYRLHHGNRKIIGDGANVAGPYATLYRLNPFDIIKKITRKLTSRINPSLNRYLNSPPIIYPKMAFDVWHTGTARNPEALSKKWKLQITREINEGYSSCEHRLKWLESAGFDYKGYKQIWPDSKIHKVDASELPKTLFLNKSRFQWVEFDEEEYSP